jgi:formamidopyrimidine-DNA glycosylase
MPELPEVEIICMGLQSILQKSIKDIIVRNSSLRWPVPSHLKKTLLKEKVLNIKRRAKYILMQFENGYLMIHLGMTGRLEILREDISPNKHDHVDIRFHNTKNILRYTDPRRFGSIHWIDREINQHFLISKLGPEPLEKAFTEKYLFLKLQNKKTTIKNIIMDSHIVVGVGNIYASESLFKAGVLPSRIANDVTLSECRKIVKYIKEILNKAIELGGSSLRNFYNVNGQSGYFQQTYAVYGRKGKACHKCKSTIESIIIAQRSSFFCPKCQT